MISTHAFTAACVEIINNQGLDALTVTAVCRKAGVSRPTFYSKLGNIEGLLAETWLEHSKDFLGALQADVYEPTANFLALSKILAVSHRVPDVSAVSDLTLLNWWTNLQESEKVCMSLWKMANRLGLAISTPVISFPDSFSMLDQAFTKINSAPGTEVDFAPEFELELVNPAPLSELHAATIGAICQWGYKNASMFRIARSLRLTSGAIYPSHSSISELLNSSYAEYQAQINSLNLDLWQQRELTPKSYGSFVRGGLDPARKDWRRLRLETLVSAQSNTVLKQTVQISIDEMAKLLMPHIISYGATEGSALVISYLFHSLGVGFGVLHDLGLPVGDSNHEKAAAQLADLLL